LRFLLSYVGARVSARAGEPKPVGRACYPPRVELEVVLACESSVFVFAPGQADAALLAKMNAITAAILK
jgi:hypothetical protein